MEPSFFPVGASNSIPIQKSTHRIQSNKHINMCCTYYVNFLKKLFILARISSIIGECLHTKSVTLNYVWMPPSECAQGVITVCPGCHHSVPRVSSECAQDVIRVCPGCHQSVPRVSSHYAQGVITVCPGCHQSVPRVSSECAQDVIRVCPGCHQSCAQGVIRVCPGCPHHYLAMHENLCRKTPTARD